MSPPDQTADLIELPLPSGAVVRGRRWRHGSEVALLLHEPGCDLDAWDNLPELLHDDGLSVVAVDLPGHGLSDDPWRPDELPEVMAALAQVVREPGGGNVFLVAAGLCASLALQAPEVWSIAGVVAFSPVAADWLWSTRPPVPARPKLVFVGAAEHAANRPSGAPAARAVAKRVPGWNLVSTFPTDHQGTALLGGVWGAQTREQTLGFLRDCRSGRPRR